MEADRTGDDSALAQQLVGQLRARVAPEHGLIPTAARLGRGLINPPSVLPGYSSVRGRANREAERNDGMAHGVAKALFEWQQPGMFATGADLTAQNHEVGFVRHRFAVTDAGMIASGKFSSAPIRGGFLCLQVTWRYAEDAPIASNRDGQERRWSMQVSHNCDNRERTESHAKKEKVVNGVGLSGQIEERDITTETFALNI